MISARPHAVVTCQHIDIEALHPNKNVLVILSSEISDGCILSPATVARCLYTTQLQVISIAELAPAKLVETQINKIGLPGLRSPRRFVN